MTGIAAGRETASVVRLYARRKRPVLKLEDDPGDDAELLTARIVLGELDMPVASAVMATLPRPAGVRATGAVDLSPEALLEGLSRSEVGRTGTLPAGVVLPAESLADSRFATIRRQAGTLAQVDQSPFTVGRLGPGELLPPGAACSLF